MRSMTASRWASLRNCAFTRINATALDEDVPRVVDQDVGDRRVAEERLDRAEAGHFPDDVLDDLVALGLGQRGGLDAEEIRDRQPDLRLDVLLVLHALQRFEVEPADQPVVDLDLEAIDRGQLAIRIRPSEERRQAGWRTSRRI
mgnify:CR=1 FL=1